MKTIQKLVAILLTLFSLGANASTACDERALKGLAIGAGVGLVMGAGIGYYIAASGPVYTGALVAGTQMTRISNSAFSYFVNGAGRPKMGAWITNTVLPSMGFSGAYMGTLGAIVGYGASAEACLREQAKILKNKF